ncbi:MAG TPA: BamA/TamA family outer membrane protein [Kiritimatiellia bacterium]|nr:BamA/TamA family outer membrane protein [Kiritimatiellia bacterium]
MTFRPDQQRFVLIRPLLWLMLVTASTVFGQGIRVGPDGQVVESTLSLPYAFYNETFGFAAGYVYGLVGIPQKQSTLLATVIAGTEGSAMGFIAGRDLQMPLVDRLFLDPVLSLGYYKGAEAFINGNPAFPDERAGSNTSDPDNFLEGDGWDNFFRLRLKYLLPMGHGRNRVIGAFHLRDGLLESGAAGGESLNPFASGRTYLELRPFYRSLQIEADNVEKDLETNGLDVSLFWDNRDFYANPSRGFGLRTRYSRDYGWFNSSNPWTNLDGELDLYLPLDVGNWARQGVLALDLWTSYSPSWEEKADGSINNNPPAYTGSTLGGLWRMRGYPSQRFNDKAAIYYSAELRMIPHWNPFHDWPAIQKLVGVQWIQFAPFVEVGRVAPAWNAEELHSDMKWSAGLGIRLWAKGIVARIDTAVSEEGVGIQMMISQPFQF